LRPDCQCYRGQPITGARNWEKSEFCTDAGTGLLTKCSPAPGLFIHYDYSNAVQCHGKTIAGAFTVTEGGRTVIEARTLGVSDPPDPKNAIFDSTGPISLGVGREMTPASRFRGLVPLFNRLLNVAPPTNPVIQVVVLHGNAGPDGKLTGVGILATTDASLNQTALDRAAMWNGNGAGNRSQPDATGQSHEALFTMEFVTYQ
jgi:hypothetical protein